MTEILDTCRIWRDIDKHPLPDNDLFYIDVKLDCGSILLRCSFAVKKIVFRGFTIDVRDITQWRDAK